MLATMASFIPIPALQLAIRTGGRYLSLASAFVDDLSILVFVLGLAILYSAWKVGEPIAAFP